MNRAALLIAVAALAAFLAGFLAGAWSDARGLIEWED